jgi:hypothetical protein
VTCNSLRGLYAEWSNVKVLPLEHEAIPFQLLSPRKLVQLTPKGDIEAATSHACFTFFFRASIMMRSMGHMIRSLDGEEIVIGAVIL